MSWKSQIQVRDLDDDQRLEMICEKCRRLVYIKKADICKKEGYEQLYLDEVERRSRCRGKGCDGRFRMAMERLKELSGFVGGIA
ncbi:hypothetical protein [Paenochrobactrum pullorum]|uniref:hypothetical protein n=1 Tax=Paenochrobactrum pullorum TaxID=1324351 RepID=UPI0035BC7410